MNPSATNEMASPTVTDLALEMRLTCRSTREARFGPGAGSWSVILRDSTGWTASLAVSPPAATPSTVRVGGYRRSRVLPSDDPRARADRLRRDLRRHGGGAAAGAAPPRQRRDAEGAVRC